MKKLLALLSILTITFLSCKKTASNYWHNTLEGKEWKTANQHPSISSEGDELYFDLKMSCGKFTLIYKFRTDISGYESMTNSCFQQATHWEYIADQYQIDESNGRIKFNGVYTQPDFIKPADTCTNRPSTFNRDVKISNYKNGVQFDFPQEYKWQNVHGYLINTGKVDCNNF